MTVVTRDRERDNVTALVNILQLAMAILDDFDIFLSTGDLLLVGMQSV